MIYQAVADRLASRVVVPGDLTERDLRTVFADGVGLVHTELGWRTPAQVLVGLPIFRKRHAFVPQVPRAERLWTALRIRQPSLEDCLRVISQIARTRQRPEYDDVVVVLETLRLLSQRVAATRDIPRAVSRRLAALALWTTQGWTTDRPVYAIDDPALIEGLRAEIPVWEPGGEVSQFASLVGPARITLLGADATTVVAPHLAQRDADATELLTSAVSLLQDDLARNDPRTAGQLSISWDKLRAFEVRIDSDLRVRVGGLVGKPPVEIDVATKSDVSSDVLFFGMVVSCAKSTVVVGRLPAYSVALTAVMSLRRGSLLASPPTRAAKRSGCSWQNSRPPRSGLARRRTWPSAQPHSDRRSQVGTPAQNGVDTRNRLNPWLAAPPLQGDRSLLRHYLSHACSSTPRRSLSPMQTVLQAAHQDRENRRDFAARPPPYRSPTETRNRLAVVRRLPASRRSTKSPSVWSSLASCSEETLTRSSTFARSTGWEPMPSMV